MGIRDLFAANAELLRDPVNGLGEQVTFIDEDGNETPEDVTFVEVGTAPVADDDRSKRVTRLAELDVRRDLVVTLGCSFEVLTEKWKVYGFGGADPWTKTILLKRVEEDVRKKGGK